MKLEDCTLGDNAKGDVLVSPALGNPVGHEGSDGKSSWNGCALKVLRLAALVFRQNSHRDIEPSQTGQAAQNKEGQEEMV